MIKVNVKRKNNFIKDFKTDLKDLVVVEEELES